MMRYAWLIPLLPAISFVLIFFFGSRTPGKGAGIGIMFTTATLILSLIVLGQIAGGAEPYHANIPYFTIGPFQLEVGMTVDGLAAVFFVIVSLVSLCSQVYSLGYMKGDRRFTIYYAFLSLFTASMLLLVIADELFELLIGWELVGICSYLLIGHWWEEKVNSDAGIKAFIVTKTGDVPFLFGIFVLTVAAGTANIPAITAKATTGQISAGLLTISALLLFGGAIGKSAQFPLQVWLPDAMAGPTPVSALIHAATMVCAGVYLVARLFMVYVHANPSALAFVGTIGAITMFIAATMALVQDDIKRVLAYSTVSQLAYMMAALSLGPAGYTPGLYHLFTHAFFKACLFYGAGSVIHAVHTNNMSEMGGLRKRMPITFWTFLIATLALCGIPPLAGFFSKDSIIAAAYDTHHYAIMAVALVTAFLTALYMARAVLLTFAGSYRGTAHPHESPGVMTAPMILLAILSAGAGALGGVVWKGGFSKWIELPGLPVERFQLGVTAVSVLIALAGLGLGYVLYKRYREPDPMRALGPAYTLFARKYYMDDIYDEGIRRPIQYPVAEDTAAFDRTVIDGAVNGLGVGTRRLGGVLRYIQTGNVQRYAVFLFVGVAVLAFVITRL